MKLYIGSKNYSSWSLRPWVVVRLLDLQFDEVNVEVDGKGASARHTYSPNGLVPCVHDDDGAVAFDSLSILELLAEKAPGAAATGFVWPTDRKERALARSLCAEMHSGFTEIRNTMPMNIKMSTANEHALSPKAATELARIEAIWSQCIAASGGPFLFGARMSAVDAFYAPLCYRFSTYNVALGGVAAAYVVDVLAHPILKEWEAAALAETPSAALAHYDAATIALGGVSRVSLPAAAAEATV